MLIKNYLNIRKGRGGGKRKPAKRNLKLNGKGEGVGKEGGRGVGCFKGRRVVFLKSIKKEVGWGGEGKNAGRGWVVEGVMGGAGGGGRKRRKRVGGGRGGGKEFVEAQKRTEVKVAELSEDIRILTKGLNRNQRRGWRVIKEYGLCSLRMRHIDICLLY